MDRVVLECLCFSDGPALKTVNKNFAYENNKRND